MFMEEFVWLNGSIIPSKDASVSIIDRGFLYGDGIFETMRSYGGRIFRLDEHLGRLFHSADTIELLIPYSLDQLREAACKTIEINGVFDGYLRLAVSRGEGRPSLDPTDCGAPTVVILAKDFIPYPSGRYKTGLKAVVSSVRRNEFSPISRIKSMNYLPNILAKLEAKARKVEEAVMLNTRSHVACATVGNIFLVKNGSLLTPSLDSGILPGITRSAILELAPSLGVEVVEKLISTSELMASDEAFLTNSLMEVMGLVEVDGALIGRGKPDPITLELHRAYRELVKAEIGSTKVRGASDSRSKGV